MEEGEQTKRTDLILIDETSSPADAACLTATRQAIFLGATPQVRLRQRCKWLK